MPSTPCSILVVDDEPDICANLADILSDLGYHVDVAGDGPSALKLVSQRHYDVALLDLKMPGMDGIELYRRLKEVRADTVAIIVTAYASDATAQQALDAGALEIVSKPVEPQNLLELVDQAVARPLLMVVDDDPDLCASLWDLFHEHGYRTYLAEGIEQAERRLAEAGLDVALVDMRLPQGDGRQVYQLIRTARPDARTVLITGHRSETEQLVASCLAAGADAVCYKPFDVDLLLQTLKKLVH